MKTRIRTGFFAFAICFFSFFPVSAQVRAVWVRPFVNANAETRGSSVKGREFIRLELEKIKRARLNTVYLESFWSGYTIYPTRITKQRPLSISYGVADENGQGWDVLQTYIEEGKKLNLKIHAWIHVFHQWNSNLGGLEKSPIFSRFPEWAMLDSAGSPLVKTEVEGINRDIYKTFLSPSNEEARRFLRLVVSELASNYPDLNGIQWDYIRYPLHSPETSFDYNPNTLAQFQRETKLDARKLSAKETPKEWKIWQDWKTRQVSEFVKELAQIIRDKQPEWEISAAVFPSFEENMRLKMQDSQAWAKLRLIDALLPMLYSTDFEKVDSWAKEFRAGIPAKTRIYPAIFIGHFYNAKEKSLDERYLNLREKFKFNGFGLFAAQSLTDDLIAKLAKEK
ncbi:MAG: family 10 glycosylhydrolase [Acidobacteriota bacterium]|nr:family 10 glycosylhydrolase [Acidobacteriota bacterium]